MRWQQYEENLALASLMHNAIYKTNNTRTGYLGWQLAPSSAHATKHCVKRTNCNTKLALYLYHQTFLYAWKNSKSNAAPQHFDTTTVSRSLVHFSFALTHSKTEVNEY